MKCPCQDLRDLQDYHSNDLSGVSNEKVVDIIVFSIRIIRVRSRTLSGEPRCQHIHLRCGRQACSARPGNYDESGGSDDQKE